MSSFSQFFGGAGGGTFPVQVAFSESGMFTAPVNGKYLITSIGGGGSGAYGSSVENARGGGAGGLAQSLVELQTGDVLTFSVGAGGVGVTNSDGNTGGTTTLTGPNGLSLTASGGAGGVSATTTLGGAASGGNIMNVTGGGAEERGGGAVGVWGYTPSNTTGINGAGCAGGHGHAFADVGVVSNLAARDVSGGNSSILSDEHGSYGVTLGRLLQPMGLRGTRAGAIGSGGSSTSRGGMFAGSGGGTGTLRPAGAFGGGGGGGGPQTTTPGAGGDGGVIIEYFLA